MSKDKTYSDEQEAMSEIAYCRAARCIRNDGGGVCRLAQLNEKISIDDDGRCIYFCG